LGCPPCFSLDQASSWGQDLPKFPQILLWAAYWPTSSPYSSHLISKPKISFFFPIRLGHNTNWTMTQNGHLMAHSTLTFSGISITFANALESGRRFPMSRPSLTSALNLSVPLDPLPKSFWLQRPQPPSLTPTLSLLSIPLMSLCPIRHGLPLFSHWPLPFLPPLLPPLPPPLLPPLPPLLPPLPFPSPLPTQNHQIP
jgi:hypothetical protein